MSKFERIQPMKVMHAGLCILRAGSIHGRRGQLLYFCVGKRQIKCRAPPPVAAEGWFSLLASITLKWQKYAAISGTQRLISRVYCQ